VEKGPLTSYQGGIILAQCQCLAWLWQVLFWFVAEMHSGDAHHAGFCRFCHVLRISEISHQSNVVCGIILGPNIHSVKHQNKLLSQKPELHGKTEINRSFAILMLTDIHTPLIDHQVQVPFVTDAHGGETIDINLLPIHFPTNTNS
jgi:hypothetical protein